jgi:hypothetical protein
MFQVVYKTASCHQNNVVTKLLVLETHFLLGLSLWILFSGRHQGRPVFFILRYFFGALFFWTPALRCRSAKGSAAESRQRLPLSASLALDFGPICLRFSSFLPPSRGLGLLHDNSGPSSSPLRREKQWKITDRACTQARDRMRSSRRACVMHFNDTWDLRKTGFTSGFKKSFWLSSPTLLNYPFQFSELFHSLEGPSHLFLELKKEVFACFCVSVLGLGWRLLVFQWPWTSLVSLELCGLFSVLPLSLERRFVSIREYQSEERFLCYILRSPPAISSWKSAPIQGHMRHMFLKGQHVFSPRKYEERDKKIESENE